MGEQKTTVLFDLERGQFLKPNKMGYTPNFEEAGRYSHEEAEEIKANSNAFGVIETLSAEENDKELIDNFNQLLFSNNVITRRPLENVLNDLSTKNDYHETNPYGEIIDYLNDNGYYEIDPDLNKDVYLDYGENKKIELELKGSKKNALISLSRLDSGRYEVVAYSKQPKQEENQRKTKRPRM
tara:strand:+ start:496 stop:1044 length:549 start_codon:yes stop_codon:yes gene_type:complete